MKFSINSPLIEGLEKKYVNHVLKAGWLSSNGEHTKIFEKKISKYLKITLEDMQLPWKWQECL